MRKTLAAAAAAIVLAGCGGSSLTAKSTCNDWAKASSAEQNDFVRSLPDYRNNIASGVSAMTYLCSLSLYTQDGQDSDHLGDLAAGARP